MSILQLNSRPMIAFDENNIDHRSYYHNFVKRRTWGYCPVRFISDDINNDLISHINKKLLNYYIAQEFESENQAKVKAKSKPKSTSGTVRSRKPVQAKSRAIKK